MGKNKTPKNGVILRYVEGAKENPRIYSGDRGYFAAAIMMRNGSANRNNKTMFYASFIFPSFSLLLCIL